MVRLLGNCSGIAYKHTPDQVQQIFETLQTELDCAKRRFTTSAKKKFSLSDNYLRKRSDRLTHEAAYQFDKQGRKGVKATKQNISKAKDGIRQFKEKVCHSISLKKRKQRLYLCFLFHFT